LWPFDFRESKSADMSCLCFCCNLVRSSSYLRLTSLRCFACLRKACLSVIDLNITRIGRGLFSSGQYVPIRTWSQSPPSQWRPSGIHLSRSERNASIPWSSSSAVSCTLYTIRLSLSCLFFLSRASAFWSNSRNLCLCSLSESSASASRFSNLLQSEDLAGEATASLKLLTISIQNDHHVTVAT